jgi:hypothetical protein
LRELLAQVRNVLRDWNAIMCDEQAAMARLDLIAVDLVLVVEGCDQTDSVNFGPIHGDRDGLRFDIQMMSVMERWTGQVETEPIKRLAGRAATKLKDADYDWR